MELTTTQKSAFISEMLSSEAGINELIRVLLDTFSKQERALFVEEHEGEQCNGSVLVDGEATAVALNYGFLEHVRAISNP